MNQETKTCCEKCCNDHFIKGHQAGINLPCVCNSPDCPCHQASESSGKCSFCKHESCPTCKWCHNLACEIFARPLNKCFDSLLPKTRAKTRPSGVSELDLECIRCNKIGNWHDALCFDCKVGSNHSPKFTKGRDWEDTMNEKIYQILLSVEEKEITRVKARKDIVELLAQQIAEVEKWVMMSEGLKQVIEIERIEAKQSEKHRMIDLANEHQNNCEQKDCHALELRSEILK